MVAVFEVGRLVVIAIAVDFFTHFDSTQLSYRFGLVFMQFAIMASSSMGMAYILACLVEQHSSACCPITSASYLELSLVPAFIVLPKLQSSYPIIIHPSFILQLIQDSFMEDKENLYKLCFKLP